MSSYATQAFWFFDGLPTGPSPLLGAELLALPYPECQWPYQDTETRVSEGAASAISSSQRRPIKLGSFRNTRRGGHLLLAAFTLPF